MHAFAEDATNERLLYEGLSSIGPNGEPLTSMGSGTPSAESAPANNWYDEVGDVSETDPPPPIVTPSFVDRLWLKDRISLSG
ncbi:hypothetical protein, partial [Acinetobacter baumannii]|uniref:hypothetical protein n=1 Tax=Acinetobacter baumannii TaxID=470 RepID=UPI001C0A3DD0